MKCSLIDICALQLKLYMYIQYWYLHDTTLIQMLIKTTKVKDVLEFFYQNLYVLQIITLLNQ